MDSLRRYAVTAAVIGAAVLFGLSLDPSFQTEGESASGTFVWIGVALLAAAGVLVLGACALRALRVQRLRQNLPAGFEPGDIALLRCRTKGFRGHWAVRFTRTRALFRELAGERELTVKAAFTARLVSLPTIVSPGTIRVKAEGHDLQFAAPGYGIGRFRRWVCLSRADTDPKALPRRQWSGLVAVVCGILLAGFAVTVGRSRGAALVEEFGWIASGALFIAGLAGLALLVIGLTRVIECVIIRQQAAEPAELQEHEEGESDADAPPRERKKIHYPRPQDETVPPPVAKGSRLGDIRIDDSETETTRESDARQTPQPAQQTEELKTKPQKNAPKTPDKPQSRKPERKVIPLRRSAPGPDTKPEK